MLQGFNKHYRIFREACQAAKLHFETGNWTAVQQAARERIDFYDKRVIEAIERIERDFRTGCRCDECRLAADQAALYRPADLSQAAGVRGDLLQFGVLQILHRTYFNNNFIFVRPAVSTEHIERDPLRPIARITRGNTVCVRHLARIATDIGRSARSPTSKRDLRLRARAGGAGSCRGCWALDEANHFHILKIRRRCSTATRAPISSAG